MITLSADSSSDTPDSAAASAGARQPGAAAEVQCVTIQDKLKLFDDYWQPRIVAELNGQQVKVAKLKGEFDWHSHADEDELFWVLLGELTIRLEQETLRLRPGDMCVIPRGVRHQPVAEEEVHVVLFEPATTINTGDALSARTHVDLERI